MIEEIILGWLSGAVENAPILGFAIAVAWDLRNQLLKCIGHAQERLERYEQIIDDLLARVTD